ncbi:MAG: ASKHA domain-containing protein, partial [Erythrobacter sp.]|nr:ASKHA domain-containing protein [Erythrobacter sp.]
MTQLLKISLPDGSVREVPRGATPADIAAAIGPGLAKAAIAAGIMTLLSQAGKRVEDIDIVYLAGGFGSYVNKISAVRIGL